MKSLQQKMFLVLLLFGILLEPFVAVSAEKKTVLYLNSYHDGYQWSDAILEGVRSKLNKSVYKIDLQVEYMDAKKYNIKPVIEELRLLYLQKFSLKKFDVVIVSDDDAFHFALKYRDDIFPGVPIVFCGVNNLSKDDAEAGNLTGVVENFDLAGTVEVALKLHPKKKRMVVVGDESTTGNAIKSQIEALVPNYEKRLKVDYWIQLDLQEVQRRVTNLPEDTFLFFIPYYQIIGNKFYTAEEVMEAIYAHSSVPLYTAWEFLLGSGAVGGSLLSGYEHGQQAASMALTILGGVNVENIPIGYKPNSVYRFDYQVMQRLKVDINLLPPESELINFPNPFYEVSRELFWTIMISVILLFITVIFLITNMVARRRVEQKMKNQLTFQETLIDTIPQLVSWKDAERRYVGANRTFAEFFGVRERKDVVNQRTEAIIADQKYANWSVTADGTVVTDGAEFRKVRKKIQDSLGETSWLEVNKVPLRDQNGKISGVLTTAENVTREHNLEKQLVQSQKLEAIGTLAGGIAHDFNNILTSIINSTELAIGDVGAGSQTEKDLDRVLKAARCGSRVVEQMLAFSRPTKENFVVTDLRPIILEVIDLMQVSLPGNIRVQSRIPRVVANVYANPTQIHQVVMNLYTNAFHALRRRGGDLKVKLEECFVGEDEAAYVDIKSGDYVVLTICDNGPGIEPEIIDKIFDPFFTSKDKAEGTGLGLAVVHGIVKGHRGGVRVESSLGRGATFEIFLPRIDREEITVRASIEPVERQGGTILFVEDDPDQLQSACRLLENAGFSVVGAEHPSRALALVQSNPDKFDLLITDFDMPGLNGVELVEHMADFVSDLPAVIVSGREEAMRAVARVDMVKKVIGKPYKKDELIHICDVILRGRD